MPRCIHCQTDYGDHLRRCPACGGAQGSSRAPSRPKFDIAQLPTLPGGAGTRKNRRVQQLIFAVIGLALLGVIGVPLLAMRSGGSDEDGTTSQGGPGSHARRRKPVQPGVRPSLEETTTELVAVRVGDSVRVTGLCSLQAAARITVAGQPAVVSPGGDQFRAAVRAVGNEVEVVAHGLDGEVHTVKVPVRPASKPAAWENVRVVSHADGQTVHQRDLHLRTARSSGPRSKVKTHPVEVTALESTIDVEGRTLTLYRTPPGFVYLRTTRNGYRTFLRLKDRQEMVLVPAGIGYRGRDGEGPSSPRHLVQLDAFLIDRSEVTCRQYARFLDAVSGSENAALRHNDDPGVELLPDGWTEGRPPQGELDLPVRGVSWYAAWRYARWAGGRLPTEAEWERSAAGPEGRTYPWGDGPDPSRCHADGTAPVAADSMASGEGPFSLLHMSGNVREWCGDRFDPRWYGLARGINPVGPPGNLHRVVRGGSFSSPPATLALQARDHFPPERAAADIGFRVVCRYSLD